MRHPFDIKTPDATFLALNQPHIFGPFFAGYLELLKKKLSQVDFIGTSGQKYSYHTCGQDHYRGNPNWKPWQHLEWYCDQQRYQFYEARDMIFSRVGRKYLSRISLSCNLGFYNIFVPAFVRQYVTCARPIFSVWIEFRFLKIARNFSKKNFGSIGKMIS